MDRHSAQTLIESTFNNPFDEGRFRYFTVNLLNEMDEAKAFPYLHSQYIKDSFKSHITKYRRLGTYTDPSGEKVDVLIVHLKNPWALERSRTMLRNFAAAYLKDRDEKDAALIAYHTDDKEDWRFSFVRMEYLQEITESGKVKVREELTPARRYSFLVGENEPNHTAQQQIVPILRDDRKNPTLSDIEKAFSVDAVTKQFYTDYRRLFEILTKELNSIVEKDAKIKTEFETKSIDTANFAKKLMGQIVFLYFLQKKGWLGVGKDDRGNFKAWGTGPKNFLRRLFEKEYADYKNFFNDILEPLFYEALASEHMDDFYSPFNCKIPFLNGGLFEPIHDYNWQETDILIDNDIFTKIFETFDRYNFTVREDEPLEKEVAVDPEMLGKVFENLLPENLRKGKGTYYTPRTIVHYMCQESLINYLDTTVNQGEIALAKIPPEQKKLFGKPDPVQTALKATEYKEIVPKKDIELLIRKGEQAKEYEEQRIEKTAEKEDYEGNYKKAKIPDSIKENAQLIDEKLAEIKVCDPAVGSGAFLVGMMNEIVKSRNVLTTYLSLRGAEATKQSRNGDRFADARDDKRSIYNLKRHCIQYSLYGVDIDPSAIDIAKLRLWLSLVVDEDDYHTIQPLPNLDYKIMQGNSLIEEFHGISLDIEKKDVSEGELFEDNTELDILINGLHNKQTKLFDAVHPRDKKIRKWEVEESIIDIFHYELKRQKKDYFAALEEIESIGKTLRGETKSAYFRQEKEKIRKRFDNFDIENIESDLREMTHGNKTRKFFPWKLYFADVFREKGGFDVVIANPPYIGERKHKEVFVPVQNSNMAKYYLGRMDYFYFFFHLALDISNNYGLTAFITTNYYPTALGAKKLRIDLRKRCIIKSLINFNELKIFDSASGQHNMITIFNKKSIEIGDKAFTCITHVRSKVSDKLLEDILYDKNIKTEYYKISQADLWESKEYYLRLSGSINSSNPVQKILSKIKKDSRSLELGKICNTIIGLESSADKIYIVHKSEIGGIAKDNSEEFLFKDFYKNSDIERYVAKSVTDKIIIYVHEEIRNIKAMKGTWDYLNKHKAILTSRKGANLRGAFRRGNWWVLNTPRLKLNFEGEKLITPYRSKINRFAYNKIPWYASRDVYYITKKVKGISLKYILALLNSKLYFLWLYHKGKRKGEMLELYSKPLSEIPIKHLNKYEQKQFITIIDKILTAKKTNPKSNTTALEAEIDRLVYELYGLTEKGDPPNRRIGNREITADRLRLWRRV